MVKPGVDKDQVVQLVTSTWDRLKRERLMKEDRWNECRLAAESEFGKTWKELANYRSKRYIPISSMALNNVSSKFSQMLLPNDDWFKAEGRTPDDEAGAILMESLCKYQMAKVGLRAKLSKLIYLICQYGNYPFSVKWRKDTITVPDQENMQAAMQQAINPQDGTLDMKNLELPRKEVTLYEGPDLVLGNIMDFVVERNPDDDLYFTRIHRFHRTKEYLEATNTPDEFGNVMYEGVEELVNEVRQRETSDNYMRQSDIATGILIDETPAVEILEMWGNFHLNGPDGVQSWKNFRAVVGNRRVLMAFEENPYAHGRIPWNLGQFGPAGDHTYAYGILEQNLGIQDDVNVRSNQIIDAHALSLNQIWKYRDDGVIDPENLISAPGTMIQVSDISNVVPLQFQDFTSQGMQEVAFMLDQFNRSTGAQLPMLEAKSGGSATQSAITAQASQAKETEIAKHLEHTVLRPILEQWFALNQQLLDDDQVIKVTSDAVTQGITDPVTGMRIEPTGPLTIKVTPEQIAGQFDVYPVGVSQMAATQAEVGSLMQFLQFITQGPLAMYLKPGPLINVIAKKMKIDDAWQFIKSQEELMLEQQQKMAMAGNGEVPGATNGPGKGNPGAPGPGPQGRGAQTLPGGPNVGATVPDGVEPGQRTGPMAGAGGL